MSRELSSVLGHIEKISELDLNGVEPTSHVVDLSNVLRDDLHADGLTQEQALEAAPRVDKGGFQVPSPGAE